MKKIFDDVSATCSKVTTRSYSSSFSLGIYFLNKQLHQPIYAIYGFVRFADEIVDTFHNYDKQYLLEKFKSDTYEAIRMGISLNPILNSFQQAVNQYNIEMELIDTFLQSMEMDLAGKSYNRNNYDKYIVGSAEVVGLMCLRVFTDNNKSQYDQLKPFARSLGAAFQKINFLRDVREDFVEMGRTYFPGINLEKLTAKEKQLIEKEIAHDLNQGLIGIMQLPASSRRGVYLAYYYYTHLFKKIRSAAPQKILHERLRIPNTLKFLLMCKSFLRYEANLL